MSDFIIVMLYTNFSGEKEITHCEKIMGFISVLDATETMEMLQKRYPTKTFQILTAM